MKPTIEQIGDLLALKRDERPEGDYWQDFICEFHQKQRQQSANRFSSVNLAGRIGMWFSEMGPSKWAYGAGLAYAAVTMGFFFTPRETVKENPMVSPVNYQIVHPPIAPQTQPLDEIELSPSTQDVIGKQTF